MSAFFKNLAGSANLLNPQGLEANRRGEITETQKQRLNAMLWRKHGGRVVTVAFVIGFVLCSLVFPFTFAAILKVSDLLIIGGLFLLFSIFGGRNLWKLWHSGTKFRRDVANCAIRQGQGRLFFNKKGYVFQASDRNLALPTGSPGGLMPGATYRVYYLEESGFLLSAEETSSTAQSQVWAAMSEILAAANGFSPEDLVVNRNGEVTPEQRRKAIPNAIRGAVFCLFALGLLLLSIFLAISPEGETSSSWPIFVIIAVLILLIGAFMLLNAWIDMSNSVPQQVQGVGHKKIRISSGRDRTKHYYYVVGGQSFEIKHGAYMALIDGLEYRVYYLPRTKRLIAIEALDASPISSPF